MFSGRDGCSCAGRIQMTSMPFITCSGSPSCWYHRYNAACFSLSPTSSNNSPKRVSINSFLRFVSVAWQSSPPVRVWGSPFRTTRISPETRIINSKESVDIKVRCNRCNRAASHRGYLLHILHSTTVCALRWSGPRCKTMPNNARDGGVQTFQT